VATSNSAATQTRQIGKLTVAITPEGARFTRVFDAPRRLVWEALSKPEHYSHWWGVASQKIVSCEMDFRPGGKWRIVTSGDDGVENAFRGEFRDIAAPERLVQTFEFEGMPGSVMVDSWNLIERDGKTVLDATSRLESGSVEDVQAMLEAGMLDGAAETYDRLEVYALTLA
jgi:uncharacterized protein YndB with AHSA1/START domain